MHAKSSRAGATNTGSRDERRDHRHHSAGVVAAGASALADVLIVGCPYRLLIRVYETPHQEAPALSPSRDANATEAIEGLRV